MKLLIDTNVILDVLLKREPFVGHAAKILQLIERQNVQEYVSTSAITDIYYIACRQLHDKLAVKKLLQQILQIIGIAAVSKQEIEQALQLDWVDFEDSVQYAVAYQQNMDGIVTRNPKDYQNAKLKIWQPEQLLQHFNVD